MSRFLPLLLTATFLGLCAGGPTRAAAGRDSSRVLPRWLELSADAGVGWMAAPASIAGRYVPGMNLGLAAGARPAQRVRALVRFEYHDLPGTRAYYGVTSGGTVTPVSPVDLMGDGSVFDALAAGSLRAWHEVWIEAGAGYGHFRSGYPDGLEFIDGATGEYVKVPGRSGWGPVLTGALTSEFQPNRRDRMFLSARWSSIERLGTRISLVPLRIGYRFH